MPGRFASLFARPPRSTGGPPSPGADGDAPPLGRPIPPPERPRPTSLQRERRELVRLREIEIRDVGGLALEMARRDDWRHDLLASRCAEVLGIEDRINELDALLAATEIAARGLGASQCKCGAPILRGAHFCSHCGRPAREAPPVVACTHCGQPLPADVNFCPVCGNAVAADAFDDEEPLEHTMAAPSSREGENGGV